MVEPNQATRTSATRDGDTQDGARLLAAALEAPDQASESPKWVQKWQMFLALLCILIAGAVSMYMLVEGPAAPREPEGNGAATSAEQSGGDSGDSALNSSEQVRFAVADEPTPGAGTAPGDTPAPGDSTEPDGSSGTPDGDSTQEGEEGEEGEEGGAAGSGSEPDDSAGTAEALANMNDQAPWAFAIVALLVGAFIATGKSFNFNGAKESS